MKTPLVNRSTIFSTLVSDLWEPAFGLAPTLGVRTSPDQAVACPEDPIRIRHYAVLRQLEAVDKKERDASGSIPKSHIEDALRKRGVNESELSRLKLEEDPILLEARDICHSVLPPLAEVWDDIFHGCGFGPGAIFHSKGIHGRSLLEKVAGGVHSCTPMLRSLVIPVLLEHFPNWATLLKDEAVLNVVRGNRLAFVPKDKSKCRTIAVEPSLNVFVQKGIGSYLMHQLNRRLGINLWDQSKNRELAQIGSIDGYCATIDLSDASDRISTSLVEYLLPRDWFVLLDSARSRETRLPDGSWVKNVAFSSQGNGFTFPLETLVFYALSKAACTRGHSMYVTCYGDDIIVPHCDYESVVNTLSKCGSIVNLDKSFSEGNFRESCGGDYLYGEQVRPVYYKEDAVTYSSVAGLHNLLIERWGEDAIPSTLRYLRSIVPEGKMLRGPRRFFGSSGDAMLSNAVASPYTSYFWDREWHRSASVRYCTDVQTYTYTFKEWGYRTSPLPKSVMDSISDNGKLLAFLYAGEEYNISPASKPCTRSRTLTVREV